MRPETALDSELMCRGSSRISSAVTPPRVAMDSHLRLAGGWTARRRESMPSSVVSPRTSE